MVVRVTVTLPDEILRDLDGIASAEGVTRSDVVREAAATYITARESAVQARGREAAVDDGLQWLQTVADRHAGDGESSLDALRALRGTLARPLEPERDDAR
jgi:predicted transcriptional regulator